MKYQSIYNRLRRIEGQIRGIEEMVAKDRPEQEILIQLQAANASLRSTATAFVEQNLKVENDEITISKDQVTAILQFIK